MKQFNYSFNNINLWARWAKKWPGNTTQGVMEGGTFQVHIRCGHFIIYIQILYFIP